MLTLIPTLTLTLTANPISETWIYIPENGSNFRTQYKSIQTICKLRKAIFSAFYNISQPNFAILLILVCLPSFKISL
jgi:hypothetical protein